MGTDKKKRVFSEDLKRQKVRQIELGEITRAEVCRMYNVGQSTVHNWIEKYRLLPKEERVVIETDSDYKKVLQLDKEKVELERCVGRQRVKLDYYEELLKLANEHFGVDIEAVLKKKAVKALLSRERPYSNEYLYSVLGTSRQSLWASGKRSAALAENIATVKDLVVDWRVHHPGMGSREMYHGLKNQGTPVPFGINKFEGTVSALGLLAGRPSTKKPGGSDGKGKKDYPNLASGIELVDINKLLVGDITYISIGRKWHYIFTLKDVYSQRILALVPSQNMKAANVLACIKEAIKARGKKALRGGIFHTDNGSQYEAGEVLALIKDLGMVVSRAGDCQQNGSAEQLNNLVKNQYLEHWSPRSFLDLEKACRKLVRVHNNERAIPQLGNISPVEFERRLASIPLDRRPAKKMHAFH